MNKLIALIGTCLLFATSFAQVVTRISGQVMTETGSALQGVSVTIKSTGVGTVTDANGNFSLNVPGETPVLVFSYIGYETQELPVGGRSVVVMENKKFLGIMTERDYSRKVALKGKSSTDTPVSEIMSTDLPSVKLSDTIEYCMEQMTLLNIRYMPVFTGEDLVGIISMSDVVKQTILNQKETINQLENYIHSNV